MPFPYQAKNGKTQYKPALPELLEIVQGDNDEGFCLACGERAYGVEPDARRYECEACGEPKVYGAEELLGVMGLYHDDTALRAPGLDDGENPFHPIPGLSSAGEY